jgi:hypothetical protein
MREADFIVMGMLQRSLADPSQIQVLASEFGV